MFPARRHRVNTGSRALIGRHGSLRGRAGAAMLRRPSRRGAGGVPERSDAGMQVDELHRDIKDAQRRGDHRKMCALLLQLSETQEAVMQAERDDVRNARVQVCMPLLGGGI
eukprot:COSAG01_NODE_4650_length_4850_cov_2.236211_5_plen_111_part_00